MKSISTILVPPVHTNMTTISRVQTELGLSTSQAKARCPALIQEASALICNFCDRSFAQASVQQKYPQMYPYRYPVPLFTYPLIQPMRLLYIPIVSIDSASLHGTAVDVSQIEFDPDTGDIWGLGYFDNIQYTGGYLMPEDVGCNLPLEIQRACIDTISMMWHRGGKSGRDPLVKLEIVDKVGTTGYFNPSGSSGNEDNSLPPTAVSILQRYKRVNI